MEPTVYIVTPVHNRRYFTEPFLRCLSKQIWPNLKIIIVDDGSTDGTSEMIEGQFPDVILLHGDGNLWWTASVNLSIRKALEMAGDNDYILVMNDDLEVDEDFVESLVRFAQAHPKSLVGAITVHYDDPDLIDDGGVCINWWTAKRRVLNRGEHRSAIEPGHYVEASYLTGRTALIPVSVFQDIGLYDEEHFINCGDPELPVRAANNGYSLLVYYGAIVKSHVDETFSLNRTKYYRLRDMKDYFFSIKSYPRLKYRYHFARTAAGKNWLRFCVFFLCDLARITVHFVRRLRFGKELHE